MRIACLMYHDIYAGRPASKFSVSREAFVEQVAWLKEHGYQSVNLYADYSKQDKSVLLTLDDGDISNLEAGRILSDAGFVGVFYVIKDASLAPGEAYLSEKHIKELSDMGHVIGIHGKDHNWWTHKDEVKLVSEIGEVKEWIEDLTQKEVITCSAPGGFINRRVFELLTKKFNGLAYIRSSEPWYNSLDAGSPVYSIPVLNRTKLGEFALMSSCDFPYYTAQEVLYLAKRIIKGLKYKY